MTQSQLDQAASEIPHWVEVAKAAIAARKAGETFQYPPGTPVNICDLERILERTA